MNSLSWLNTQIWCPLPSKTHTYLCYMQWEPSWFEIFCLVLVSFGAEEGNSFSVIVPVPGRLEFRGWFNQDMNVHVHIQLFQVLMTSCLPFLLWVFPASDQRMSVKRLPLGNAKQGGFSANGEKLLCVRQWQVLSQQRHKEGRALTPVFADHISSGISLPGCRSDRTASGQLREFANYQQV